MKLSSKRHTVSSRQPIVEKERQLASKIAFLYRHGLALRRNRWTPVRFDAGKSRLISSRIHAPSRFATEIDQKINLSDIADILIQKVNREEDSA